MKLFFTASAPDDIETAIRFVTGRSAPSSRFLLPRPSSPPKRLSLLLVHASRTLYAGVGEAARVDGQTIRSAAGAAAKLLQSKGRTRIAVDLGPFTRFAQEAAEGVSWAPTVSPISRQRPADGGGPAGLESVCLIAPEAELATVRAAGERGPNPRRSRQLRAPTRQPAGNLFFPETLAQAARALASQSGGALEVTVLDEAGIGFGRFWRHLGRRRGSQHGPRLIVIRYRGGAAGDPPLVFCGKSITFDSGGLSIKPADRMEEMIWISAAVARCWAR